MSAEIHPPRECVETAFCLGSNLGHRAALLRQAKTRILMQPQTRLAAQAPLYETVPVDVKTEYEELRFLNTVLVVTSSLTAEEWLARVKRIEAALGRVRSDDRNAPRTIDIDILYSGGRLIDSDLLQIPHTRWTQRRFVVQPLADVRPEKTLPGCTQTVRALLASFPDCGDVRLFAETW